MTAAALQAQGWGWRYATRLAWAVSEVTFSIEPGERVLLLGASGAGKSTVLHALGGVLGGDDEGESTGTLLVDGAAPSAVRGRAGMVLQDPDSQAVLSRVGDDVAFGPENLGVDPAEIPGRVRDALDAVGLDVPLDRSTAALSGGQKQRLALAGVLAMRPGALLLDEPTANLDPDGVLEVRDAVVRALEAVPATLVVVEHRIDVWLPIIDRVIVLGSGGVIADGTPDAVLAARGPELAAAGVWVPGIQPQLPDPPRSAPGPVLLSGRELVVARVPKHPVAGPLAVQVRSGEALGIVGPNGAGKSTLALTLAGLIPREGGDLTASEALADGLRPDPYRWRSRELLTRMGMVFQEPEHQLLATTVRAELAVGLRALKLPEAEVTRRVDELLQRLRLDRLAEANPYTLSGGEQRRLTVAAVLATQPLIVLLDEPTFGQDAVTWAELVALMAELRDEGRAIVAVTHDLDVLDALHARRLPVGAA
ncbi:ABC transporter ATP-binding protein [Microbacterium gorillae]|uniref:ABC transporter ATP-binding protein n=1 Tax=Microbacterium gorillae TaxID=1231063 RepID=UPI000B30C689|nr:ATP-binding cassette domain-containing protein [Microbacterium gorillae]